MEVQLSWIFPGLQRRRTFCNNSERSLRADEHFSQATAAFFVGSMTGINDTTSRRRDLPLHLHQAFGE